MSGSWVTSALELVRARNLLLSAAGVAIGGVLAQGRASFPPVLWWAMASAVGLGAAGNVANDLADRQADAVNRPGRPLVSGTMSVNAAILIGGLLGGLGLLIAFVPASLAPWFAGWYGWRYGLVVLALDLGLLVVLARLLARQTGGASARLKGAMVLGLVALLWDRL